MLTVGSRVAIPDDEFTLTFARSSAPGGQNVNKVNSKAVLRWHLMGSPNLPQDIRERFCATFGSRITVDGDVVISSEAHRDQGRNIQDCKDKLAAMLQAVLVPPKPRKKTRPTRGSVQRRLTEKSVNAQKKGDRRRGGDD